MQEDFEKIASLCRHGNYKELEEVVNNQQEYNFTHMINACTESTSGNTLLHISAQNGHKRVAKLLLRNGAEINSQNFHGQTVLHFAFAYGFTDLGEYLVSKGADDSVLNKSGMTCYEGLNLDAIP